MSDNVFSDRLFKYYWNDTDKEHVAARNQLIKDNPPSVDEIVDFVVDVDYGRGAIDKLYYIYQTEALHSLIGWSVQPGNFGLGGYLKVDFYKKLLNKIDPKYRNHLFSFIPTELQTDELLIAFIGDREVKDTRLSNYRGGKPKTSTLEWMIDNALSTIADWKEEWWTRDLKERALLKDSAAFTFLPDSLITADEIKSFLIKHGERNRSYMRQLWSNLDHWHKNDPEIFARWLHLNGGLGNNIDDIRNQSYFTLPGMKEYFKLLDTPVFGEWKFVPRAWKEDLVDVALPNVYGAIALDPDIELTDDILNRTLNHKLNEFRAARIAHRLQKESRLTLPFIEKIGVNFHGIEGLSYTEKEELFKNPYLADYLVKKRDKEFLMDKFSWLNRVKFTRENFIDIVIALELSKAKIKTRIKSGMLNDDDYIWIYFESNKLEKNVSKKIKGILDYLVENMFITISKETKDIMNQLPSDATYESYKAAMDIFIF